MTPDLTLRISVWREKAIAGTLSIAEMQEAITYLRQGRMAAHAASATSRRAKAKAEIPSADELLNELEGL